MACISYADFKNKYHHRIRARCILPRKSTSINTVTIRKYKIATLDDFEQLKGLKVVWYKSPLGKTAQWDDPRAQHIEISDENELAYSPNHRKQVRKMIADLKTGRLTKNIEMVLVTDLKLDETIVVDGVHRALALYHIFQTNPEVAEKLVSDPQFGIYLVNFRSPKAAKFFGPDFSIFKR